MNLTLQGLVGQCIPGAKIIDLCEFGHTVLHNAAQKLFTKKVNGQTIDRGVAFPVCVSVNDIVCNHSPLATEERVSTLECHACFRRNLLWSHQVHYDVRHSFLVFKKPVWLLWAGVQGLLHGPMENRKNKTRLGVGTVVSLVRSG